MVKNRIISAVLTIVLALASTTFVMAEDTAAEGVYTNDMKIMSALGLMKKISADDENAAVTKGAFTAAIMDLLGVKVSGTEMKSPFSDVNTSTNYYAEICSAAQYGIAHGDETPKFEPDSAVTYRDAAVMLVNALGYHDYAIYNGGYPNGYLKVAAEIGLNKNLNVGETARLTSGMCARILLNAGDCEVVNVTPYQTGYKVEKGDKLFWEKHRIVKDTGLVEANEFTSIDTSEGVSKNQIKIGGLVVSIYYSNESTDYLGYNVEFYYRDNNGDLTVLYMQPKRTEVTVIDSSDINSYEDGVLSYNVGDRGKKLNISKDVSVIYNGVYTINYVFEDGSSIFCPRNGEIKAIDNDNDGKAEVISVLSYENVVVSAVNMIDKIVYDKYNPDNILDFENAEQDDQYSWILTNASGIIVDFSEIKEKSVISVAKSMNDKVLRGVLSNTVVSGNLKAKSFENDEIEIVVGDTSYIVTNKYFDRYADDENNMVDNIPAIGSNVTLYLDFLGKVAEISADITAASSGYAFVMRVFLDDAEDVYYLKLLTADGIQGNYKLAKTVRLDGVKCSNGEVNEQFKTFNDYQVILYKMNSAQEITSVDTASLSTDKEVRKSTNEFDRLRSFQDECISMGYYSDIPSFNLRNDTDKWDKQTMLAPKPVVFKTPKKNDGKGNTSQYDYTLYSVTSLPTGINKRLEVRCFGSDPDSILADCVQYIEGGSGGDLNFDSPYMVVSKVEEALSNDDEPIKKITGYNYSGEISYAVSQDYKYDSDNSQAMDSNAVKAGDVIKFCLDSRNEISFISPVHIMGTEGLGGYATQYQGWYGRADWWAYAGWLAVREGRVLGLVDHKSELQEKKHPEVALKIFDNTAIYYVSQNKKTTVEKVNVNNLGILTDYKNSYQCQQVLAITSSGQIRVLVVYEAE